MNTTRSIPMRSMHYPLALLLVALWPMAALAQRDLKNIPDPDPELERQTFEVADGFEVNLFAADPSIAKPIQMNFDAEGRLWIASSEIYPHIKPGQVADDKIVVVEDTDGDGRADSTSIFADGLLIPTGVEPGDGGAYVANSTELIHLKDTDGDGRADQRRVVLSGFGTEDTHHLLHTLRWGPDGALYMNQSIYIHSHVETPTGVKRLNGGGIWRFRPEAMDLEVLCYGFVNPWGHHFDRWGQSFATDGAYGEGINYVFPGSVFVTAPGATRIMQGLNPGSPKHCGLEVLSGGHLPDDWQGNMITNDFRAHRVCRFVISEDGAGYASRQETELIKTTHVAFRPIDVKMGPDGAIYIADWYNPIIQHGEVDFRDPRRDHVHGRIWRVTAKNRPLVQRRQLADASTAELLEVLKADEQWNRLYAKLILKQRGADAVLPHLNSWLAALDPQDAQYEHHRLEALWLHECLGQVNGELLEQLLSSGDHRVRAAAFRTASHWREQLAEPLALFAAGVSDEHPRVRLEAVTALAEIPALEAAELAARVLEQPMDRFLDFALWKTMRELAPVWLPAVQQGQFDFAGQVAHLTYALKAVDSPAVVEPLLELIRDGRIPDSRLDGVLSLIASLGGPEQLAVILDMVVSHDSRLSAARRASLLQALVDSSVVRKERPAGDLAGVAPLLDSDHEGLRVAATRAVGAWKLEDQQGRIAAWALGERPATETVRRAAVQSLGMLGGPRSMDRLAELAESNAAFVHRADAVAALASLDARRAAELAVKLLQELPEAADPADVMDPLLQRKNGAAVLVAALKQQSLEPDVAKLAVRAARGAATPSEELVAALQQSGGLADAGWKLTPQLQQQLVEEVARHGDAARGEEIYRRKELQCTKCHAIAGAGGRVGPDLVSIGASAQVDYLVESLLDPNNKIKENFHSTMLLTDDGRVVTGIPVRETEQELVLRDAEDQLVTIPLDAIDERQEGRSLMPAGVVDSLTRDELVDLVRFMSELGKVGDFAVGQQRVARNWQTLLRTDEAHFRLHRTSFDTAASDDEVLQWEPVYSKVSGHLPLDGLPEFTMRLNSAPTSFIRCRLEVTTPGAVALRLNGAEGLALWVDGRPTTVEAQMQLELGRGTHTLTLAVNRQQRTQPLRLELVEPKGDAAQVQLQ